MPIETQIIQGETLNVLDDASLLRTQTENQERDGAEPGFDEFGLRENYVGTGYLDINGSGGGQKAGTQFTAPDAGAYDIVVRLANGSSQPRALTIDVDGVQATIDDTKTDSGWGWGTRTVTLILPETTEPRALTLSTSASNGPNLDAIAVAESGTPVSFAAPVIETTILEMVENGTEVGDVIASDLEGQALGYSISGGADAEAFTISADGTLSFAEAPDFETPASADGTNDYEVEVSVTDGVDTATQLVTVSVTDDPEVVDNVPPDFDLAVQPEAGAPITDAGGQNMSHRTPANPEDDVDGKNELGLWDGYFGEGYTDFGEDVGDGFSVAVEVPDDGFYDLHTRYANGSGSVPSRVVDIAVDGGDARQVDFDRAGNAAWDDWNVKTVNVFLTAGTHTISYAITEQPTGPNIDAIALTATGGTPDFAPPANTAPAFVDAPATIEVAENTDGAIGDFVATDVEGATVGYALSGADADLFDVSADGKLSFKAAPDHEAPADDGANNVYDVVVEASDGELTATQAVAITVTDVDDDANTAPTAADGTAATAEDTAVQIALADLIADAEDGDADLAVTATSDEGTVVVDGTDVTLTPDADFSGDATISYTVTDTGGLSAAGAIAVTVAPEDDAPTAVTLTPVAFDENAPGAVVATIDVTDVDDTASVTVSDTTNYRVIEENGVLNLALAEGVALDAEAASQPAVFVTADGVDSAPFTPAPGDVDEGGPVSVLFDAGTVEGYSSQDKPATGEGVSVSPDGTAITLDGNLWKRVPLPEAYTITGDTRIEVDVAVGSTVPEIVAVGFDTDENPFNGNQAIYQLAGTQNVGAFTNLKNTGEAGRFTIDLSAHAGTTISSLVLISDDDAGPFGSATFSNLQIVEATDAGGDTAPRVVGGGVADLTVLEGGAVEVDLPFVEDDGDAVTLDFAVTDGEGNPVTVEGLAIVEGALVGPAPEASGTYTVTLTATDKDGAASDAFTLTVEDVNDAPVSSDPALEPYAGTAGQAIDGIDLSEFAAFFTDPEEQDLAITAEDLPAGLSVEEGFIVGTPTAGGQSTATIRATDPGGLSATLEIVFDVQGGNVGDTVVVEAEDFTGLGSAAGFFATGQAGASGDQIIRSTGGAAASVTTDLTANGLVEGWYRVAMTRYDETDGSATYSLAVGDTVLASDAAFDDGGTFDNGAARGNAGQAGNLKTIEFDRPVYVSAGTVLTLSGVADAELLRTDKFAFTRIDAPNEAPSAPALDASSVAENDAGAVVGAVSSTDPDGDDAQIAYTVDDPRFEVVDGQLKLVDGASLDFEAGAAVDVAVTATDALGASATATLTITVTDVDEAPLAPTLTGDPVTENVAGASAGTLSATSPDGKTVTFTTDDPRFEVVGGTELKLKDGVSLDFEAGGTATVSVTADDGAAQTTGDVTVAVADANDAPTLAPGASLDDARVGAGVGATIPLAGLGAADEDAGDTVSYAVAGANGTALPSGFAVVGTDLVVPTDAPAGTYEVEVFATDGEAASESVSLTVTVGEPAPFEPFAVQGQDAAITLSASPDGDDTATLHRDENVPGEAEEPGSGKILENGLRAGYSGTGYIDFGDDAGDTATFTVSVPSAGQYDLSIRYASQTAGGGPRVLDLAINGDAPVTTTFPSTGPGNGPAEQQGFNTWGFLTRTVDLQAGDNAIALAIAPGTSAGPNVDSIEITPAGTGPIAVDDSADADGNLALDGPDGELNETQAASINLNASGLDDDIVKVEISFDGGATRTDVTDKLDADGDFVFDGSALPAGAATATIIVTDAAGNEAEATKSFTIAGPDGGTFTPTTIQAEDGAQVTVTDVGDPGTGPAGRAVTTVIGAGETDAFGNDRENAVGDAFVDFGEDPGDSIAIAIDVPTAGTYTATIRYANGAADARTLALSVNGAPQGNVAFTSSDDWDNWVDVSVDLELDAGANTVTLAIPMAAEGGTGNGPNIDQITFETKDIDDGGQTGEAQTFEEVVQVNFEAPKSGNGGFNAPASYSTPAGFEADTGEAFGDRGNGFTYGWVDVENGAVTATPLAQPTGSMRYKNDVPGASDLQKTYAHFEYPGAPSATNERAWEMALENGTYQLTVAIGDTGGKYDSTYLLNVEGQPFGPAWNPVNLEGEQVVQNYDPAQDGEGFRSDLMTGVVQVADGRLTLDSIGGENTEIQWLELERIPDVTPADGRSADLDYSFFVSPVAASLEEGQVSIAIDENGEVPTGIDPTSSLVVGINLQAPEHRGPSVAHVDGVRLVETLTGDEVAINVQITGGADSLTIKPLQGLKENTSYTLVLDDVLDLGNLNDASLPQRQFQDFSTTFVTGEAPDVVAREVAFTDEVVLEGSDQFGQDGKGFGYTSIEFGPDGKLYVSTIGGMIHRWDVNSDGSIDAGSIETLSLGYFQQGGRSIIGMAFDPEDPNTIWVTDNAPVPREGKASNTPEFSGQVSKITLGAGGSFEGAEAEAYITGLPRSGGDHVTNSLEFRANPDAGQPGEPDHLLYLTQGSNSAAGRPDNAWGFRPERLLNAAALEVDPRRDAPEGGFDVQTEPYDPATNSPTFRTDAAFNDDGTFDGFYDPFEGDAVLKIFGEGIRNAYDLVWHSNGHLYTPTNGTARGGNTLDDPSTPIDERVSNLDKQFDYLFRVEEGGYYGHPNDLLGHYVVNGGNPTAGPDPNSANTSDGGNEYPVGVEPDPDYDLEGSYSLGFNKSPNGAIEYTGDAFGPNLQGALLFAQFSVGDNVRVINVDPTTGLVTGDDVLRRPGGDVIDDYIDPLDLIQNPATGQIYLMTLNRGNGQSEIVLLTPAPGGVATDNTADEGGDLALVVVDDADASAVQFRIDGLDADIDRDAIEVSFGSTTQTVSLSGDTFTLDMSGVSGATSVRIDVEDDADNTAEAFATVTPGGGTGGEGTFIDATAFNVLDTDDGTIKRIISDPSTHETTSGNDADGDGLNDGYDGAGYIDPNGGTEPKASFVFDAPGAGTYSFAFRMAANSDRSVAVQTGDQSVPVTVSTGTFTNWTDFPVTLTLEEGANTIVIAQTSGQGPNIDSVTVTPIDVVVSDDTADEGGDLALSAVDLSDPAAAVFAVAGADDDIETFSVSVNGGAAQAVTPDGQGQFTLDLGGLTGAVSVALTVADEVPNTASASASVDLGGDGGGVPNDGTETVDGKTFVVYEAEKAALTGTTDEVTTGEDDRGQSGGAFVDFDGAGPVGIAWTIEVPEAGTYQVDFLYALAAGKDPRPMQLSVDGGAAQTVPFPANSNQAETVWGPSTVALDLAAGVHTLELSATGAASPNLDYLRVTAAPLSGDLTADEGGDLALSVVDQTDASAVVFQVDGLDADITEVTVSFNGGAPVTVTPDASGQFTADPGIALGTVDAVLTVTDGTNFADASADFSVTPNGNPNADIAVQSGDPTFFENRLHFSFLQNDSASSPDRSFKDSATVTVSNTGTEPLELAAAEITGPFDLADPTVFDGLVLAAGASIDVEVLFDATEISPKPGNGQNGVQEGALTLTTNDAEDPIVTVDLAGFWQARDEGGWEPNVNEVWQTFGFGNFIEGLALQGGGENSVLNFYDLYIPQDETEVLSPYWRIADGVDQAMMTKIAAFHGDGGASMGIHAPGNKGQDKGFGSHAGDHNQRILPLKNNGEFFSSSFGDGFVPDAWEGDDVFGFEVAGLSTDPTLNPSGGGTVSQAELDATYPGQGYTVENGTVFDAQGNEVPDGYTVRMFQAVDAAGNEIPNVFLGVMDYTGINYDYNDNMFVVEGVTPVGAGGSLSVSGLDDAAADDRLVFTNIDNPDNGGGVGGQNFRDTAEITLTNDGIGALDVTGLTIGGADAADFEVSDLPGSIAPGASATVTVTFVGSDPADDGAAELRQATLTIESDTAGPAPVIQLAGLAQLQSEQGEEPSVAQIVEAFGYGTDVAQGQLKNGGTVETVGDEVLMPYLERLDGSQPVEVINLAAFLQQTDISRLSLHELEDDDLTELFVGDDQQGQTVLPDGLVVGAGDTGSVARASIDRDEPFGLKVTVDGRPTFAAWTDPEINKADDALGVNDAGHYIRFFQAKDAQGEVIEGTYIGIQDYPGGGNFDYNDAMFLVRNVQPHGLTAANDADQDGVNDALQTDADDDGLVAFFDEDDSPVAPAEQTAFNEGGEPWGVGDGLTLMANLFDEGGQGVAHDDDGSKQGDQSVRPGTNVDISNGTGAIGYTNAGEWIEYTISVPEAGDYALSFNSSSPANGRTLTASFEKDGSFYETATAEVPNTGAYTSYADTEAVTVALEAGVQVMRVNFDLDQQDLMSFTLAPVAAPTNQAPTAGEVAAASFAEGASVSVDAGAAFSDADGDALTFTAAGLPAGLSIDPGTGLITGAAPPVDADTDYTVTVTGTDPDQASASETFTLTVTDAATPTGQASFPGPDAPGVEGGALTVDASDYDQGGQGVAYNDDPGLDGGTDGGRSGSDVEITGLGDVGWIEEGEWLEYTVQVAEAGTYDLDLLLATNGGPGRSATVTFTAAGADAPYASTGPIANPDTGGWTNYQPRSTTVDLEAGEQVVRVAFAGGSQDFRSFTLTPQDAPTNAAPTTTGIGGAPEGEEGQVYAFDVAAFFDDADADDTLSFSAAGLPAGLSISDDGVITGTPQADGTFTVTVTASDGEASVASDFALTVEDAPEPDGQQPFPGSDAPGFTDGTLTVDASNYDEGGQDVAYNDAPGLEGGGADGGRTGSDVEQTGLGDIGWIGDGEWVEYTIDVPQAGLYDVDLLLSLGGGAGRTATMDFFAAGVDAPYASTGPIANPSTGGWTDFEARSAAGVALQAGEQVVRVTFEGGAQDFRSFTLTQQETGPTNAAPTTTGITAAPEAEENDAYAFDVSGFFDDPDEGDVLSFSAAGLPSGLGISAGGQITGAPTEDGSFAVTVTASDGEFSVDSAFTLTVEAEPAGPTQAPFPGPDAPVLGQSLTVDATDFDSGGQGVSWNDDPGLDGGSGGGRPSADVELVGSQADIGYVGQGEWVEYTIDVQEAGTYDLGLVAKSPIAGNTVTVSIEGGPVLAAVALPDSNGGSDGFGGTTFASTDPVEVELEAGLQTLRFAFDGTPANNGYLLDMRSFSLDRVEDAGGSVVGEAGTVTFGQGSADQWFSVEFAEALENPSVVMGPISLNGGQQATMRVREVTETGFEFQLDEWDYLDGGHATETVSWVAIESGVHQIGGQTVIAGTGSASEGGSSVAFGPGFDAAPVVLAQVTSTNDPDAVTDRIDAVTAQGFDVALDDEEANASVHGTEDLAWIAVEEGGAPSAGLWAAATGNQVTHTDFTQSFGGAFANGFAFLADMQTEDGSDPAVVRLAELAADQATVFVEEEQSSDAETNHTTEVVGMMGVLTGAILSDDPIA